MTILLSLSLCMGVLATPPVKVPTSQALDPRFLPPPKPKQTIPKWLIASGAILVVAGLTGLALQSGCRTYDDKNRCVDPYNGRTIYPALVVFGFGATITGSYWYRRGDRPPD